MLSNTSLCLHPHFQRQYRTFQESGRVLLQQNIAAASVCKKGNRQTDLAIQQQILLQTKFPQRSKIPLAVSS